MSYWERLELRDRPGSMQAMNPRAVQKRQPRQLPTRDVAAEVLETIQAQEADSKREQAAADKLALTVHRELIAKALAGSKDAAASVARIEPRRRGHQVSQEGRPSLVGATEATTADRSDDTGDQAM